MQEGTRRIRAGEAGQKQAEGGPFIQLRQPAGQSIDYFKATLCASGSSWDAHEEIDRR